MATVPWQSAIDRLIGSLSPDGIAIQIPCSLDCIRAVLLAVARYAAQPHQTEHAGGINSGVPEKVENIVKLIDEAIPHVDLRKLANEQGIPVGILRLLLASVIDQARKVQDVKVPSDTTVNDLRGPKLLQALLAADTPVSHIGDVGWPESAPAHTRVLRDILAITWQNSQPSGEHAVLIPAQDLDTLLEGIALLEGKTAMQVRTLSKNLSPFQREQVEREAWDEGQLRAENATKASQQVKKGMMRGKGGTRGSRRRENPVEVLSENENIDSHSIVSNGTFEDVAEQDASSERALPSRDANDGPTKPNLCLSVNGQGNALRSKHSLSKSPGQSPVKKKPRSSTAVGILEPKKPIARWTFFSRVERAWLREQDPTQSNNDRTRKLTFIWHAMTPREQAPFDKLAKKEKERYAEQIQILDRGGTIDSMQDWHREDLLWKEAEGIPRSRASLEAMKAAVEAKGGQAVAGMLMPRQISKHDSGVTHITKQEPARYGLDNVYAPQPLASLVQPRIAPLQFDPQPYTALHRFRSSASGRMPEIKFQPTLTPANFPSSKDLMARVQRSNTKAQAAFADLVDLTQDDDDPAPPKSTRHTADSYLDLGSDELEGSDKENAI